MLALSAFGISSLQIIDRRKKNKVIPNDHIDGAKNIAVKYCLLSRLGCNIFYKLTGTRSVVSAEGSELLSSDWTWTGAWEFVSLSDTGSPTIVELPLFVSVPVHTFLWKKLRMSAQGTLRFILKFCEKVKE